jgi:Integral membrane protein CcmA involved in cell shape determination
MELFKKPLKTITETFSSPLTPVLPPNPERQRADTKKENAVSLKTDEITTILGKGSEFEGKLHFEGTLRIEGVFSGEIRSNSILVVGESARITAEIDVATIVINGEVKGNIRASQSVEIRSPARMTGNIETPNLVIDKGVIFEGQCKMENLGKKVPMPLAPVVDTPVKKDKI